MSENANEVWEIIKKRISSKVENYLSSEKMDKAAFSQKISMSDSYTGKLLHGDCAPLFETYAKIVVAMDVHPAQLLLGDGEIIVPAKQMQFPGMAKVLVPLNQLSNMLTAEEKMYLLNYRKGLISLLTDIIS